MKKKIIIFGATGNIGVYLTDYLLEKVDLSKYEIIAVGRKTTSFFDKRKVTYYSIDIKDKDAFHKLPKENIFAAVHLANLLPARMTLNDPYEYFNTNLVGSINILEYLRATCADRIIFTQTYADIAGHWEKEKVLYPDLPRQLKYTGDHALYTISKCAAEDVIRYYHETFGLKNFIIRLPNIYMYAPNEYYYVDGKKTLISYRYIINKALAGEPIELWGNPNRVRDMIYIKDLCQLIYRTLVTTRTTGHYNAGTGVGTSLQEQIEGIIDVFCPLGKKSNIIYCANKKDAMEYVMDITNARVEVGYEPEYYYREYLLDYKKEMHAQRFQGL